MSIELEFPDNNFLKNSINLYIGKPKSGKSYTIKSMMLSLCQRGYFDSIYVFSNIDNDDYNYLPKSCFFRGYNKNMLSKILKYQDENKNNKCALIFDDLLGSIKDDDLLTHIITTFRHYNLSLFFTAQYLKKIPTVLRNCLNYCYIFNALTKTALTSLYEEIFNDSRFDNLNYVKKFVCDNTKGYNFIFVDLNEDDEYTKYKQILLPDPKYIKDYKIVFENE